MENENEQKKEKKINILDILKYIAVHFIPFIIVLLLVQFNYISPKLMIRFSEYAFIGLSLMAAMFVLYKLNSDKLFLEDNNKTDITSTIDTWKAMIEDNKTEKSKLKRWPLNLFLYLIISFHKCINFIFKFVYFIYCQIKDVVLNLLAMDMKTIKEKIKNMLSDNTSKYFLYSVITIIICMIIISAHIGPVIVPNVSIYPSNNTYEEGPYNLNERKAFTVDMNNAEKPEYIDEFSLSCWFFLGNTPVYDEQQIISFDDRVTAYIRDHNKLLLKIDGSVQTSSDDMEMEIPLQKWNQLVINYKQGYVDVFVNNKLVQNQIGFKSEKLKYKKDDSPYVHLGSKNTFGGIKQILFKKTSLSRLNISIDYFKYRLFHEGHIIIDDFVFA